MLEITATSFHCARSRRKTRCYRLRASVRYVSLHLRGLLSEVIQLTVYILPANPFSFS